MNENALTNFFAPKEALLLTMTKGSNEVKRIFFDVKVLSTWMQSMQRDGYQKEGSVEKIPVIVKH